VGKTPLLLLVNIGVIIAERLHSLFDQGEKVGAMDLVEVDIVEPEPHQAFLVGNK